MTRFLRRKEKSNTVIRFAVMLSFLLWCFVTVYSSSVILLRLIHRNSTVRGIYPGGGIFENYELRQL